MSCTSLKSIRLPEGIKQLGRSMLSGCTSLTEISIPDSVIWYQDLCSNCTSLTKIKFPSTLNTVAQDAFKNCTSLVEINLPDVVRTIERRAFSGCTSLKTIKGGRIWGVQDEAFKDCVSLSGFIFDKPLTPDSFYNGYIASGAFRNCTSLTTLELPIYITTIGERAFAGCTSLSTVTAPVRSLRNCVNHKGDYYDGNYSDNWHANPRPLTIGSEAFAGDTALTHMELPNNLSEIGVSAFSNCPALSSVLYFGTDAEWNAVNVQSGNENLTAAPMTKKDVLVEYIRIGGGPDGPEGLKTLEANYTLNRKYKLDIYTYPDNAANKEVTFTSSDPKKASVDANGNVQLHAVGDVQIAVRSKDGNAEETYYLRIRFEDVCAWDKYYYEPVYWALEKGITGGTSATTFSPDATCTRAQVVTFLWRAAGAPAPRSSRNPFKDVVAGKYYYNAVLWAVENSITNGISATQFGVNDPCTRGQVVTFLHRAKGKPASSASIDHFTDVAPSSYYADAVRWAVETNVTGGTSATKFSPNNPCLRGQTVTFLYRAYK